MEVKNALLNNLVITEENKEEIKKKKIPRKNDNKSTA